MKTLKMEINFQDTQVPIYTDFREISKGYAFLFGNNKKVLEKRLTGYPLGVIEDANGVDITYLLTRNPLNPDTRKYIEIVEKADAISVGLQFWLFGKFVPSKKGFLGRQVSSKFFAYDIGRKEEFSRPDLLE